jgi:hypothetical protein
MGWSVEQSLALSIREYILIPMLILAQRVFLHHQDVRDDNEEQHVRLVEILVSQRNRHPLFLLVLGCKRFSSPYLPHQNTKVDQSLQVP